MIGNNFKSHIQGRVLTVGQAGHLFGAPDDGPDQVGIEIRGNTLNNRGQALQAHAGVNTGFGQGVEITVLIPIELHKDEIPDFQIAVAVAAADAAVRAAGPLFALIE